MNIYCIFVGVILYSTALSVDMAMWKNPAPIIIVGILI
jgi:hypothetical protein